jgi:hypothetical protein
MAFSEKAFEHMIEYAIRAKGVKILVNALDNNTSAFDKFASYIVNTHKRAMESMDNPIDLQNVAEMSEEFNENVAVFMNNLSAALNINGEKISFAQIFDVPRVVRPEYLFYLTAKFIGLFASSWVTLNVLQKGVDDAKIKPRFMKFKERAVDSVILKTFHI